MQSTLKKMVFNCHLCTKQCTSNRELKSIVLAKRDLHTNEHTFGVTSVQGLGWHRGETDYLEGGEHYKGLIEVTFDLSLSDTFST